MRNKQIFKFISKAETRCGALCHINQNTKATEIIASFSPLQ